MGGLNRKLDLIYSELSSRENQPSACYSDSERYTTCMKCIHACVRTAGGGQLVVAGGARVEGGVDLTAGGVTLRVTATMYCTSTEFSSNKTCKGRSHCNRSLVHVHI